MSDTVIQIENLSKYYHLGVVSSGTISHDINRWWAKFRGKPDPTLRVDQLEKKINSISASNGDGDDYIWALRNINLEIKQGEVLGIIGRNGAGKSTLLKILSRITAPTTGECRVKGRIASLLEVGTGFHPELTGRENIFLNGAILGMTNDEIRAKFDEIVSFSEVEKYIDTPVKRYSSGMYVRLAFAVAAHLDPDILIVDEVLAVGDIQFQNKCIGKMRDVSGEGRTVLLVSHNMTSIRSLATKCLLLERGAILSQGPPRDIVNRYMQMGISYNEASIALAEHDKRLPGMKPYLQRISCRNESGVFTNDFVQDENICIEIEYQQAGQARPTHAGFGLYTNDGMRVTGFNTAMAISLAEKIIPASGVATFWIAGKSFNPGRYLISPSVSTLPNNLLDKVEYAIAFSVHPSDIYSTGYILTSDDGVFPLNCMVNIN